MGACYSRTSYESAEIRLRKSSKYWEYASSATVANALMSMGYTPPLSSSNKKIPFVTYP